MKLQRQQRIFFERTKEMIETAENLGKVKDNVVSSLKNPGKLIKDKVTSLGNTAARIKKNPKLAGRLVKRSGKNLVKFIKKNPRDAAYLVGGNLVAIPIGKAVEKRKGKEAGIAAAGTVAALPIGEVAMGTDHLLRSKAGKTGIKAAGQVIKGSAKDLGKWIIKRRL